MAIENLTTYTETDPNSKLTVTSTKVTAVDLDRDEDAHVYKNFGASYFDAIDVDFEIYIDSNTVSGALGSFGLANTVDDCNNWSTYVHVYGYRSGANYYIYLRIGGSSDNGSVSADTLYYCTLSRVAGNDTVNLYIYTDSSRQTLHDTLTQAGAGANKYQYFYAICSYNDGSTGADWDGYYQNID